MVFFRRGFAKMDNRRISETRGTSLSVPETSELARMKANHLMNQGNKESGDESG
jgi:hypothetical protein